MALAMADDADTTDVAARCHHTEIASVELDEIADFAGRNIDDDRVVDLQNVQVGKQTWTT